MVCATRFKHDQILLLLLLLAVSFRLFFLLFFFVFSVSSGLAILFDTFVLRRKNFTTHFAFMSFFLILFFII